MSLKGPKLTSVLANFAKAVEAGSVDTVKRSAEMAKAEQLKRMKADSGGDLKLSGVNKAKGRAGNAPIGASYKVTKSGSTATAVVKATGPLQIINNDTQSRRIGSAWAGGTRARRSVAVGPVAASSSGGGRRAVLNTPFGFRRSVRHPGTTGKDTWQLGRGDAEPKIRQTMSKRTTAVISKGMRV